jgi:hypothetical protein
MWLMQVAIDQIVDVVGMRNWLVTASHSMHMARVVGTAPMTLRPFPCKTVANYRDDGRLSSGSPAPMAVIGR